MQQDLQDHQRRAERIETLLQEVASFPDPHARATTEELIQLLLDMYGEGLARILELVAQGGPTGKELVDMFAQDELIGSLFLLHGLHPIDIETRVARALVEVHPYLKSHGGIVELVRIENGVAYLRFEGKGHGCASSAVTLQSAIEDAIYKAVPDLEGLQVEGINDPPLKSGIPVTFVPPRKHRERLASTQRVR